MSEPQPPAWWQPPPDHVPARHSDYSPPRPHFRERRPVRWWTVFVGFGGSVVWYLLVALAARGTTTSLAAGMLLGAVAGGLATGVLAWKGDVGLSVGIGMVTGLTLAVMVFLTYVSMLVAQS